MRILTGTDELLYEACVGILTCTQNTVNAGNSKYSIDDNVQLICFKVIVLIQFTNRKISSMK